MAESWFELDRASRAEILEIAADKTGRPAHLLEKDVWIVWALSAIYGSALSGKLTFKGGTSLSKVYGIIDRFSEDVDLTYDIRELVPDKLRDRNPLPESRSQEKNVTSAVNERLPLWINSAITPIILDALRESKINATLILSGKKNDTLLIEYDAIKIGNGYASPTIRLEFGARATGEPHQQHHVECDMLPIINGIAFPVAHPLVMAAERTFWEKATAAHVYCLQQDIGKERFSRHWYDIAAIAETPFYEQAITDRKFANEVALHKEMFFRERDASGLIIDYRQAAAGDLRLVPCGESLASLGRDYAAMLEDGLLTHGSPTFDEIIEKCKEIEIDANCGSIEKPTISEPN